MKTYEIAPRLAELGGGYSVTFFEDGKEMGAGVFPVEDENPQQGMDWWNRLREQERGHWLALAVSAVPADAWAAYLRSEAYQDALNEGENWLAAS